MNRYKIYVEGWAWSVSEKYILACDSPTLYINPHYYTFFSRGMTPLEHFWPIRETNKCRSLKFGVEWGNHHTSKVSSHFTNIFLLKSCLLCRTTHDMTLTWHDNLVFVLCFICIELKMRITWIHHQWDESYICPTQNGGTRTNYYSIVFAKDVNIISFLTLKVIQLSLSNFVQSYPM